ncbi:MAG: hypothetical protein HQL48_09845, partial [Gammaproteobacteria bacterium]|nr:hypothetical protein [Gammaproteobacteria bacterium]
EDKLQQRLSTESSGREGRGRRLITRLEMKRFIQLFQRLTEHSLAVMPERVNYLYQLDAERNIINHIYRPELGR